MSEMKKTETHCNNFFNMVANARSESVMAFDCSEILRLLTDGFRKYTFLEACRLHFRNLFFLNSNSPLFGCFRKTFLTSKLRIWTKFETFRNVLRRIPFGQIPDDLKPQNICYFVITPIIQEVFIMFLV